MQNQKSKNEKGDKNVKKNTENTTESGYGEMIYMEPGINQMMSPITSGRQTRIQNRSSIESAYNRNQNNKNEKIENPKITKSNRQNLENEREKSPNSNINEQREKDDYNIRTLNERKSPKGAIYQTYTNLPENINNSIEGQIIYNNESNSYQVGNDSNIVITTMGGQFRQSPTYQNTSKDVAYIMNPREGNNISMSKMSPTQNIDDFNSSGEKGYEGNVQLSNLKNVLGNKLKYRGHTTNDLSQVNELLNSKPTISRDNLMDINDNMKYNSSTYYNHMTMGDVKKIVKRFTQVYDPKKTKEGSLINEKQIILPGANDDVFNGRYRVLQKMNRLSNILLAKNRNSSFQDSYDVNTSIEDNRKTFDRHTLNRNTLNRSRMSMRNRNRSPENKFLYVSLAMISSKGRNAEDRIIFRNMRFEKGGVVDLAQEDRKKNKAQYKIKKAKRRAVGTSENLRNANPKYREQAAKLIQAWWRELKELYKERLNMIIKIQSFWRGRWVRKYMYDILYLSFMYQSFCQIIQKVLVKYIRPIVFDILMAKYKKGRNILKSLLLRDEHWKLLKLKPFWDRWRDLIRAYRRKSEKGRKLIDLRNTQDKKKRDLTKFFSKWAFLSKFSKLQGNHNIIEIAQVKKKGIDKIINGSKKLMKKESFKNIKPKLKQFLQKLGKIEGLKLVSNYPEKTKERLLKKYLDKWLKNSMGKGFDDFKVNLFEKLLSNILKKLSRSNRRSFMNKLIKNNIKKEFIERIVIQEKKVEVKKKLNEIFLDTNILSAAETLQRALWRFSYKDPLNAISNKLNDINLLNKLRELLKIREAFIKRILKHIIKKWNTPLIQNESDLISQILGKLIRNILNKRINRILISKLNKWRNSVIIRGDTVYKQKEDFEKAGNLIRKNSLKKVLDEKPFFENLKNTRSEKVYNNILKRLFDIYFNKDEHLLRYCINKWRDQCRKDEIRNLINKLLKSLIMKNYSENMKLLLNRAFHKWLQNKTHTIRTKKTNKNTGALLIKSIRGNFIRKNIKYLLRKYLRQWNARRGQKKDDEKKERILKAKIHLLQHNKNTNGKDLLNGADLINTHKKKHLSVNKIAELTEKTSNINLRNYLKRWLDKIKKFNRRESQLLKAIKVSKTNSDNKDKIMLLKAFLKWRNLCRKKNSTPIQLGLKHLLKGLLGNKFKHIMKRTEIVNIDVKRGESIYDALLRGDKNVAKCIALRNLFIRPYFNRWKRANDNVNVKTTKDEMFKKLIKFPFLKISQIPLRNYLKRWRDIINKLKDNEIERKIYLKLLKNIRNNRLNEILREYLYRWRKNKSEINKKYGISAEGFKKLRRLMIRDIFNLLKKQVKKDKDKGLLRNLIKRLYKKDLNDLIRKAIRKWAEKTHKEEGKNKDYQFLRNLINSRERQNNNNTKSLLHQALLRWRINSVPLIKHDYKKVNDFRAGLLLLKAILRRPLNNRFLNGLKNKNKDILRKDALRNILKHIRPKIKNYFLRKALNIWKEKLKDTGIQKNKAENIFSNFTNLDRIRLKMFIDYKCIIEALKLMTKNKNKFAEKLQEFFKKFAKQKKKERTTNGANNINILLKKTNKNFERGLKRLMFAKWKRITRFLILQNNSDIIKKFVRGIKHNKLTSKKKTNYDFSLLLKTIKKNIFDKFKSQLKKKRLYEILRKRIFNKENKRKKLMRDYLKKWMNVLPKMRLLDSVLKIQSMLRARKGKKNYDKLKDKLSQFKTIIIKLIGSKKIILMSYIARWNMISERLTLQESADIIKKFCKIKVKHHFKNIKKGNLQKIFRNYLLKKIIEAIIKAGNIDKKNGQNIIDALINVLKRNPFKKFIKNLRKKILLTAIKKALESTFKDFKGNNLPKYFKRFVDNTIGENNKKAKIIQNWLKHRNKKLKVNKSTKKHDLLLKIVQNLINNKNKKLKAAFKYWKRKAKINNLTDGAVFIQKIWRGIKGRIKVDKKSKKYQFSNIFRKYFINNITSVLKETNLKFYLPMKNAVKEISNLTKRYATNNLVEYLNNTLRNNYVKQVIKKINLSQNLHIMQKYLNRWKKKDKDLNKHLIKIQTAFRKYRGKLRRLMLEKARDKILSLFLKYDSANLELLRASLRKWQLRNQVLKCEDSSVILQEFLLARIGKYIHDQINDFFSKLTKKLLSRLLKNVYKFNKLRLAILKSLFPKLIHKTTNYNKNNQIDNILNNHLDKTEQLRRKNSLQRSLTGWKNNTKQISDKELNSTLLIQKKLRGLISRKKFTETKSKNNKFRDTILKFSHESPLRVYFNKYKLIVKRLSVMENADIIKKFCKFIRRKVRKEKDDNRMDIIKKALEILDKFKPGRRFSLDKIRQMRNRKLFDKVINDLANKRKKSLKDVFDKLFGYGKDLLNNRVFKIPDNLRKRLLDKWLKIWLEKAKKLSKLRAAEMLQKNWKIHKKNIKTEGINNSLNNILKGLFLKNDNILKKALHQWRNKVKNMKVKRSGRRIANFVINKFKFAKAKENWKKLSNKIAHKDQTSKKIKLMKDVKKYMKLRNAIHALEKKLKLNGWNQLKQMLNHRNKLRTTNKALRNTNKKNNLFKLSNYLKRWLNQTKKILKRENTVKKIGEVINARKVIIALKTLNSVSLMKKLFHDIPRIRALDFFNKLKKYAEKKRRLSALGKSLIKSNYNINGQNVDIFMKKLHKIYGVKVLNKMVSNLEKLKHYHKLQLITYFLRMFKLIFLKNAEFTYYNRLLGGSRAERTKLQFSAKLSTPHSEEVVDDKERVYLSLAPYFIDWLNEKIKIRQAWGIDNLIKAYSNYRFNKLYRDYAKRVQIPQKVELYNKLYKLFLNKLYAGPLKLRLMELLRKYAIHQLMIPLHGIGRFYRLLYLIKLTFMCRGIAKQRFCREFIRRWKFVIFSKILAKKKMELMYKNLHLSYLQLANDVFGDEDTVNNASVVKEFERFGNEIGMFTSENVNKIEEHKYSTIARRKFKYELNEKNEITAKKEKKYEYQSDSKSNSRKVGKKNEIIEIQSKNSEEISDYSRENSRTSSYRRNRRGDDINTLSSHSRRDTFSNRTYEINNEINTNENEYKPNTFKGRRKYGN